MLQLFEGDEYFGCAGVEKANDFIPSSQFPDIDIDGEVLEVLSKKDQVFFNGLRSRVDETGAEI